MSSNAPAAGRGEPNHARRFGAIWLISSLIATPLVIFVLGPDLPPGHGSDVASGQVTDNTVLLAMATPVLLMVVIYMIYAVINFRQAKGSMLEGPVVRGHQQIQTTWIIVTSVLVLSLAIYGTVRLEQGYGAGSGSGPKPLTVPSGKRLPVQVIAQQWAFTYRYPTYGGVETAHLELPVNTTIEFHVTSLDVIHSFWAYQLGVKADANPNVDNIAFAKPTKIQTFEIHCAELCGIWHGGMFDHGHVVSAAAFSRWITQERLTFAPTTKVLPKYSTTYLPEPYEARRMSTTTADTRERPARPVWRRLIGFNLLTAVLLGIAGYYLGWFIGHQVNGGKSFEYQSATDENDVALLLAYVFGVIGFLIGLGFANYPFSRLLGKPASLREKEEGGIGRYFGLCTDHKVVGIQYLCGIGLFFFIGGLNAMLIRTELLSSSPTFVGPNQYLSIVGMHGTMMMGMMTSGILGPFANYFVPIMIGARRMAFPRIEALTFWLLMAAGFILCSTIFFGGFPTGWTGYEPLNNQAVMGMDSYIMFFALVGISMCLLGLNMMATIITMRAPGLTWSRLPIFVWAVFATSVLMVLAAPMLVATLLMSALDRTINTSFFIPGGGGSSYLYQNLFWFFGHPEVYILALPGFGIVLELLPVFTRKPLWGYRLAISGMLGVTLLSFFVWQHHLFVSGINADLRPFYMLSTEIISLPTGFIFLCVMGTLWRSRISFTVPMLFCLAWVFNFLIGGLSGVFLSDTPSDTTTHGSFFVMAHFHYTIMGGLIFTFFAAIYYWVPKMVGLNFNEKLGKVHFWLMFISFNSTFLPLFVLGFEGMPRRVSFYEPKFHTLNVWVSVSAFVLGFSMLIFLFNVVYSLIFVREKAPANPWHSKSLEWQVPTPVPVNNFEQIPVFDSDPYDYGTPVPAGSLGGPQAAGAG